MLFHRGNNRATRKRNNRCRKGANRGTLHTTRPTTRRRHHQSRPRPSRTMRRTILVPRSTRPTTTSSNASRSRKGARITVTRTLSNTTRGAKRQRLENRRRRTRRSHRSTKINRYFPRRDPTIYPRLFFKDKLFILRGMTRTRQPRYRALKSRMSKTRRRTTTTPSTICRYTTRGHAIKTSHTVLMGAPLYGKRPIMTRYARRRATSLRHRQSRGSQYTTLRRVPTRLRRGQLSSIHKRSSVSRRINRTLTSLHISSTLTNRGGTGRNRRHGLTLRYRRA